MKRSKKEYEMDTMSHYHEQRARRCACAIHGDGLVASDNPSQDLANGIQLYRLADWPQLLKPCGCPWSTEPPDIYDPLTIEQAEAWIARHENL